MNQSTTTQLKSRFRPVKVVASDLPAGPLPDQAVRQDSRVKPAIIRTVGGSGDGERGAKVRLVRQDEVSHPKPRMLPEQRLDRYVQNLRAPKAPQHSGQQAAPTKQNQTVRQPKGALPVVTWITPKADRSISLSEASLIKPKVIHQLHSAHSDSQPHLQEWPEEQEATNEGEARLRQTTELDEQLRQLEMRIESLKSNEVASTTADRSAREKAILSNPDTSDLVTAISTAIVSALQEKPEAEVLPKAKSLFEKNLQQRDFTEGPDPVANETTMSAMAAVEQQMQQSTVSTTNELGRLRDRIGDYQRMMTQQSTTEAANLVKLSEAELSESETAAFESPETQTVDQLRSTDHATEEEEPMPSVQFTSPENAAIPLNVASWDVEDFRWPTLTDQMLTSGGDAIKELLAVAMDRTDAKVKRIVVAGAGRGQGSTTIAISLARAAINAGYRTLLVDADVASPQLSQNVGLSAEMSWMNGIGSELPLGESVIRSKKSNLCLMPLTSNVKRVTCPRFIFDNLGEMVGGTESHFDLILIDAGPASQLLDELSSPEHLLDAMVLVDSTAKLKEIEVYQNRLRTFGINNLVLAENRKLESSVRMV